MINTTAKHAAPIFLNALSNGFAKLGSKEIVTRTAPLPVTKGVEQALDSFSNIVACLFIIIAFSFVPGSIIVFVVKERESSHNSKHQQLISGVSIPGYWVASYLWDVTLYCLPLAITMIVMLSFDFKAFTGEACIDWNTTAGKANPMMMDFFATHSDNPYDMVVNKTCADVVSQYGADATLPNHYGTCAPKNPSNAVAVSACGAVTIVGNDNELLFQHMTACTIAGMVGNISYTQSLCKYTPVFYALAGCEAANTAAQAKNPPDPLMPCDVTLSTLCPITTDTCPVSRTAATFLLFWGFGLAIISFSYVFSYLFAAHTNAQIYSILVTFLIGLVLAIVSMVLDTGPFDPSVAKTNRTLKWFYRLLSPGFCLGNGLLDMSFSSLGISLGGDSGTRILVGPSDPLGWDHSGRDIFFLFISAPVMLGVAILIDYAQSYPLVAAKLFRDPKLVDPPMEDDEDVMAEIRRVESGGADNDAIKLLHLRKVYRGGGGCSNSGAHKVAVR